MANKTYKPETGGDGVIKQERHNIQYTQYKMYSKNSNYDELFIAITFK